MYELKMRIKNINILNSGSVVREIEKVVSAVASFFNSLDFCLLFSILFFSNSLSFNFNVVFFPLVFCSSLSLKLSPFVSTLKSLFRYLTIIIFVFPLIFFSFLFSFVPLLLYIYYFSYFIFMFFFSFLQFFFCVFSQLFSLNFFFLFNFLFHYFFFLLSYSFFFSFNFHVPVSSQIPLSISMSLISLPSSPSCIFFPPTTSIQLKCSSKGTYCPIQQTNP